VKRRLLSSIALLLLVAAWANGCGGEPTAIVPGDEPMTVQPQSVEPRVVPETMDEGTSTPTLIVTTRREEATMTPTSTPAATEVEPPAKAKQAIRLAREDLARRLGLAPEAIRLVSLEAVEWSDTSLGCPQPGMMYAQVITPGFRVVLEAKRQKYPYHTDASRFVVLCRGEGLPIEPVPLMPVAPHGIPGKPRMPAD
jgi:hypothetical protein